MAEDASAKVEGLIQKRERLIQRLQKGRDAIRGEAEKGSSDRADQYFEVWLSLLTDYEQTVDELRSLGPAEQPAGDGGDGGMLDAC